VSSQHHFCLLKACRDYYTTTKEIYIEIVEFTYFVRFWTFDVEEDLSREKRLIDKIKVSAGINLDRGYTKQLIDKRDNNEE
jgi:hypothetical protein